MEVEFDNEKALQEHRSVIFCFDLWSCRVKFTAPNGSKVFSCKRGISIVFSSDPFLRFGTNFDFRSFYVFEG